MPRLDRYLSSLLDINRKDVRLMLAQGRVEVDGAKATNIGQVITAFSQVCCDGQTAQANKARYLMLHKPTGVVSATRHEQHRTVIDLLHQPYRDQLHIVGRLDLNSTGLILLTNNGQWSRQLSLPTSKLEKRYRVTVEQPITQQYVDAFENGVYFAYENITTRPATLNIRSDYEAEVVLTEGRYHQIKRMFGHFDNKVLSIHRFAVGKILLDKSLAPGQSRELTAQELN
ncbi:pseudouridine synthase [Candidatus Marimicrobium litorale]|uniref:Pseudouridine synthase n=1 Tax=Candidatus Marimicrobium litorale TaxID=2518991 RepID=A0ABT3T9B4_9GAMM|nr:16S rRNA pseudouridine(516) synthase [Candidatus Marimicrobium litorale]MCX2978876.1 pseudouridine synthase [Candidatus Marimicrobium litorale]